MPDFDLLIRGAEPFPEIGIADGKIVSLKSSGAARGEIDATGLHVFPGVIDSHVHFNEPGRTDWEGIETGSRALAAGGGTLFFDMPLNAHPPTCDVASFELKLATARKNSLTDFAFWGGLVPQNPDQLERLADCGVIGFKAFMSNSGISDFERADYTTLQKGMKCIAKTGLLVALHAESESLTQKLASEKILAGKLSARDYLDSRPIEAELEAIRAAIDIAGDTRCPLHIVHVSNAAGVALVVEAKQRGADVTCETCPHYLTLTNRDVEKLGAIAKCAPPLRSGEEQEMLWQCVLNGGLTTIGSDHSPSPPEMKTGENFFKIWGGISGVQHTLPLLLTKAKAESGKRKAATDSDFFAPIVRLLSTNVAGRFKIPDKGKIAVGYDADLAFVNLNQKFTVRAEDLFYRHKQSPYVGRTLTGRVVQTILRGKTIFKDGKIMAAPSGRLIKPTR